MKRTRAPGRKKNLTLSPRGVVKNFRAIRRLEGLKKEESSLRGRIEGMQFEIEELQRDSFWGKQGMAGRRTVLITRFGTKQRGLKSQLEANKKQQAAVARQINGGQKAVSKNSKQKAVGRRQKNRPAASRKKTTRTKVLSKPFVIRGKFVSAYLDQSRPDNKIVGKLLDPQSKGYYPVGPRGQSFKMFRTVEGAKEWGRKAVVAFDRAAEGRKSNSSGKAKAATGRRTPKSSRKPNKAIKMTYALAMAAGADAANRQMKQAGRETWNRADHNKAVSVFERLYGKRARLENPRFPNPPIWADIIGGLAGGAGYAIAAGVVAEKLKKKTTRKQNKVRTGSGSDRVSRRKSNRAKAATGRRTPKVRRANHTTSTERLYKEFQGRGPTGETIPLQTPGGTPKDVSMLGPLVDIRLKNGEVISFSKTDRGALTHPKAFVGQAQRGAHRRIYVGLVEPYSRFQNGDPILKTKNFGPAASIAYWAKKPHLKNPEYDGRMVVWEHKFGDRGGRLPNVLLRPNGCIDLRYGDYTVMSGGIDN